MLRESGIKNVSSKDIKMAFEKFDTDHDGTISKKEMKVFIRTMGGFWK